MDNVTRSVSKIIYWIERGSTSSIKEYNDLKQRLMEIGIKNLLLYLTVNIYLKVLEKTDWNIIFLWII